MEASSPLAALHHPLMSSPSWGGRDIFGARPHPHCRGASGAVAAASFSLREKLQRGGVDYFNVKDLRGSSPAASLAADLSQNFRIDSDHSPHFPTPRRALFTAKTMSGMEGRHHVTTPPLHSSSPANQNDMMDLSPLPHTKAPFVTQVEITSPTPITTPTMDDDDNDYDAMMLDSPVPMSRQASLEPPKMLVPDRRMANARRPSLSRMKGFTTMAVPARAHAEPQVRSAFCFDADAGSSSHSIHLSPSECFASESPPHDGGMQSPNSPCASMSMASRARSFMANPSGSSGSRLGSPVNYHYRRQSNPFLRSRKQVRRSLSMFENPADVVKAKSESDDVVTSSLKAVVDLDHTYEPTLPHFLPDDPADTIPRITRETLLEVLDGQHIDKFDHKMLIDCRFEYEYDGGHIDGAVNHNDKELLAYQLFDEPIQGRALLIFHCEYSAHRAPLMARHIRSTDRSFNAESYPKLTYPDVYILDGGYSAFFTEHRARCFPPEYVAMSDEKHQRTCEREMGRLKARKGLGRAQTFAFGSRDNCPDESPTGPLSRAPICNSPLGYSPSASEQRSPPRRLVSF
ncbi:hypothetical protein CDD82_4949 [Ophiocordyceps australis]|uniref:M-phase inducer phosphatase n=1 Tax=Ophiocordyceps australis TaxID=1399860 RepID=A0A2C5Z4V9_9HYPO|nr:hypothetical protein CDD82_4949 [Ophiocordyceps australis]